MFRKWWSTAVIHSAKFYTHELNAKTIAITENDLLVEHKTFTIFCKCVYSFKYNLNGGARTRLSEGLVSKWLRWWCCAKIEFALKCDRVNISCSLNDRIVFVATPTWINRTLPFLHTHTATTKTTRTKSCLITSICKIWFCLYPVVVQSGFVFCSFVFLLFTFYGSALSI